MHRYFLGIVLIQVISVAVFWVNLDITLAWSIELVLKIVLPLLLLATTTALWFDTIGRGRATQALARMQATHARDREKLQLKSEREKHKVIKQAHKEITRQTRRASGRANLKVGAVFLFAGGVGVVMLLIELVTFGMMTLMTAGGALSGYLFRARREKSVQAEAQPIPRVINEPTAVLDVEPVDASR